MFLLSTTVCLSVLCAFAQGIIDGNLAKPGQFPYIVFLEIVSTTGIEDTYHYASGTIVSDRYILTDAYSLYDITYINVTFGATDLLTHEPLVSHTVVQADAVTLHPSYEHGVLLYSIATIELPERIRFTHLNGPVKLLQWKDKVNNYVAFDAVVVGYGKTKFLNPPENDPERLRYRELVVIDNEECAEMVNSEPGKFEPELICTVSAAGLYDNGSPLTVQTESGDSILIGILSHTYTKVSSGGLKITTLNLYTRVTDVLDFIENSTNVRIFD